MAAIRETGSIMEIVIKEEITMTVIIAMGHVTAGMGIAEQTPVCGFAKAHF
jgi:hypothetical protein